MHNLHEIQRKVDAAMRRCFQLGEKYFRQSASKADWENRMALETHSEFTELILSTVATLNITTSTETGWQPIETAPKTRRILIARAGDDSAVSAEWCNRKNHWSIGPGFMYFFAEPSHWMPIPDGPVTHGKQDNKEK